MSYDVLNEFNQEAIQRVVDVSDMIEDERSKENSDESKITRLLFEQMLRCQKIGKNSYTFTVTCMTSSLSQMHSNMESWL